MDDYEFYNKFFRENPYKSKLFGSPTRERSCDNPTALVNTRCNDDFNREKKLFNGVISYDKDCDRNNKKQNYSLFCYDPASMKTQYQHILDLENNREVAPDLQQFLNSDINKEYAGMSECATKKSLFWREPSKDDLKEKAKKNCLKDGKMYAEEFQECDNEDSFLGFIKKRGLQALCYSPKKSNFSDENDDFEELEDNYEMFMDNDYRKNDYITLFLMFILFIFVAIMFYSINDENYEREMILKNN